MKKIFILFVAVISAGVIWAQDELCHPEKGIEVDNFHPSTYRNMIVADDGDEFIYYSYPNIFKKGKTHTIGVYNKKKNSLECRELPIPKTYTPMFMYSIGDEFFSIYFENAKKKGVNIIKAFVPKKDGEIQYETRMNFRLDKGEYVQHEKAESPDGKKHAFLYYVANSKEMVSQIRIFVYDEFGKEILYKIISPEMYGGVFRISDISLTNDGEVAILLLTGDQKRNEFVTTAIQVILCNDAYVESIGAPFEEGIISSMRLCQLKNGNYFIGGYYESPGSSNTDAFFHCFVNTETMEISEIIVKPLEEEQIAPKMFVDLRTFLEFNTACSFIKQLDDGSIMMIGEHRGAYYVSSNNGSYYVYHMGNIIYQHFDSDGELLAAPMLKKHQKCADNLRKIDDGYTDIHISISPFVSGSDVYILYNDSQSNFKSGDGATANASIITSAGNCTVMAKLADSGPETQLVMLPDKKNRQVNEVLHSDGTNVYFYTSGLKQVLLHHFIMP